MSDQLSRLRASVDRLRSHLIEGKKDPEALGADSAPFQSEVQVFLQILCSTREGESLLTDTGDYCLVNANGDTPCGRARKLGRWVAADWAWLSPTLGGAKERIHLLAVLRSEVNAINKVLAGNVGSPLPALDRLALTVWRGEAMEVCARGNQEYDACRHLLQVYRFQERCLEWVLVADFARNVVKVAEWLVDRLEERQRRQPKDATQPAAPQGDGGQEEAVSEQETPTASTSEEAPRFAPRVSRNEYEKLQEIKNHINPKNTYIGSSVPILRVFQKIEEFNQPELCDKPVLILGPSGVGKTGVAELIHRDSPRRHKPYKRVQAVTSKQSDPAMMVAQWVGVGKDPGSPNLPPKGREGWLQECEGGTLFVDEAANLALPVQELLMDVCDKQDIPFSTGEGAPVKPNIRLVFATNGDLERMACEGTFKHDLYRRIRGRTITIPALCERTEDIVEFVRKRSIRFGRKRDGDRQATFRFLYALLQHDWPGNVGELLEALGRSSPPCLAANSREHCSYGDFGLQYVVM